MELNFKCVDMEVCGKDFVLESTVKMSSLFGMNDKSTWIFQKRLVALNNDS
jgi:hypothetical protein